MSKISEVACCDNMEFMAKFPDKFFDLAIVDPPYGISINVSMGRRKGDKKSNYHRFSGEDKSIPDELYFKELFRVSTNQVIWGGNYMTEHLSPSPCWLMWDKGFSQDVTFAQYELAWTSFKSSSKKYDLNPAQLFRIHPTQKPTGLYRWIIQRYANPGDKILDTHMGSQSSRIAAHIEGFDYWGCELDPDYFREGCKRFEQSITQQTLF